MGERVIYWSDLKGPIPRTRKLDLILERKGSFVTGETECNRCGACCLTASCTLTGIAELEAIAQFSGVTLRHAVKNYIQINRLGNSVYVRLTSTDDGACSFYDDVARACTIHAVKPADGRDYRCWVQTDDDGAMPWFPDDIVRLAELQT